MTAERSRPAPLPPSLRSPSRGRGSRGPHPAARRAAAAAHNRSRGRALWAPNLQVGKLRPREGKDWLKVTRLDWGRAPARPRQSSPCSKGRGTTGASKGGGKAD